MCMYDVTSSDAYGNLKYHKPIQYDPMANQITENASCDWALKTPIAHFAHLHVYVHVHV